MEGVEQFLTTPPIPSTINRNLLNKLEKAPYVYIRENLCFGCCIKSFSVYTAKELGELLYTVKDEGCCNVFFKSCAKLCFYDPKNSAQFLFTYPDCCQNFCLCKCCKCDCKCDICHAYSEPLVGYYGNTKDITLGQYRRQYCCLSCCSAPTWIFYNKLGEITLKVKLSCCDYANPCFAFCKLFFDIYQGGQILGQFSRSPRCFCSGYTYEIQFPADITVEDRLMLIALCCKAP